MAASAVVQTLRHAWITLEPLKMPIALLGGLSLAYWRHPRLTHDVDLTVNLGTIEEEKVIELLTNAGFRRKRLPVKIDDVRILQMIYEPPGTFLDVQVDLLFGQTEYYRQAIARRVLARLPDLDFDIYVLACEDLILHKITAGRLIDKSDAAMLLRLNRANLDFEYLSNWVGQLQLLREWNEIWNEAFPGEPSTLS